MDPSSQANEVAQLRIRGLSGADAAPQTPVIPPTVTNQPEGNKATKSIPARVEVLEDRVVLRVVLAAAEFPDLFSTGNLKTLGSFMQAGNRVEITCHFDEIDHKNRVIVYRSGRLQLVPNTAPPEFILGSISYRQLSEGKYQLIVQIHDSSLASPIFSAIPAIARRLPADW